MFHEPTGGHPHIPVALEPDEDLAARRIELINLLSATPVTEKDRTSLWFQRLDSYVGPSTEWQDRGERLEQCFLSQEAERLLVWSIDSGVATVVADLPGRGHSRLGHREFFGQDKWWSHNSVCSGRYQSMNTAHDHTAGKWREAADGLPLRIRNDDWPAVLEAIICRREALSGQPFQRDRLQLLPASRGADEQPAQSDPNLTDSVLQWSLYDAVAWIASRDIALVDQQSKHFAQHRREGKEAGRVTWVQLQQAIKNSHCKCGFSRLDCNCTDDARETLRAQCEAGQVRSSGVPKDRGERRIIPPTDFISAELFPGDGATLHRVIGGKGEAASWHELRFAVSDVQSLGSAATQAAVAVPATSHTGAPGRPSSKHLVMAEFNRRAQAGDTKGKLSQEADALLCWFSSRPDFAELAPMAKGTIENAIRDAHREAVRPQK